LTLRHAGSPALWRSLHGLSCRQADSERILEVVVTNVQNMVHQHRSTSVVKLVRDS